MCLMLHAMLLCSMGTVSTAFAVTGWYIEAESVSPVSPWVLQTEKAGYTGSGYFFNAGTTQLSPGGHVQYTFTVDEAGTYKADLRGRRDKEGNCAGQADDQCNDIYTQWDNGTRYKTMLKGPCDVGGCVLWGDWFWQSQIEVSSSSFPINTKTLTVGTHVFHVEARSMGVKLDAIAIYKVGTARPSPGPVGVQPGHSVKHAKPLLSPNQCVEVFSATGVWVGRVPVRSLPAGTSSLPRGIYYLTAPGLSVPVGSIVNR